MLRVMSHPAARLRLLMFPGTRVVQQLLKICFIIVRLGIVGVVVLLFMRSWWWALACFALVFSVNTYLQTFINYEIGARLFVLDQHMRELYEEKKPKDEQRQ